MPVSTTQYPDKYFRDTYQYEKANSLKKQDLEPLQILKENIKILRMIGRCLS